MVVTVDRDKCMGSGNCVVECPEVFSQEQDGTVILLNPQPAEELREKVEAAVGGCPAVCITVTG
jgi:ferredoxin